jgi:hypothetical protein
MATAARLAALRAKGPLLCEGKTRALFLDVETDGLGGFRPPTQRVMQVAWVLADLAEGGAREEASFYVQGVRAVNPRVPHDITPKRCWEQGVPFEEAARGLADALGRADCIVAHNAEFDVGCILRELQLRGCEDEEVGGLVSMMKGAPVVCSMRETIDFCGLPRARGGGLKFPTLSELHVAVTGEVPREALHDALNDCRVLERCVRGLQRPSATTATPVAV